MANNLTGDFDVVAQFSVGAANRVLAAMHRAERFPHSLTLRVDDIPGPRPLNPVVVGSLDVLGDATLDPGRLPPTMTPAGAGGGLGHRLLDAVANLDLAGVNIEPVVPSHLKGRAQLQLSPPMLDVAGGPDRVTVRMDLIARYFPDPGTPRVAEFVRGGLSITAPVAQSGSQTANVIDINFRSPAVSVGFTPSWSSAPIPPEDLAAINLLIRNALKTSFLPSNVVVPPRIRQLAFRTFGGNAPALAMLLNVREESVHGNPASANTLFLGSGDEFAFAAGLDLVQATFGPILDEIRDTPIPSFPVAWTSYRADVTHAELELQAPDRIVLKFRGTAKTSSWLPNFGFKVSQVLRMVVDGPVADFVVGQLSVNLTSDIADYIASPFKGTVRNRIARMRDDAIQRNEAHDKVRRFLNADQNLGVFLNSFFAGPRNKPAPPETVQLAYTSVGVQPEGIVLHGSLAVSHWPPPHVEFQEIPAQSGPLPTPTAVNEGSEYSALRTWIPGGVIQHYEWHRGPGPHYVDPNRFVLLPQGPIVSSGVGAKLLPAFSPLCLTISGVRLTASGPVAAQPVGATFCAFNSFPIFEGVLGDVGPAVALVERDPQGLVHVTGETVATRSTEGGAAPHAVVHFADATTLSDLEQLVSALREAGRDDGTTAVVAVMDAEHLKRAPFVEGVTYADSRDDAWRKILKVQERGATTLIVTPDGRVTWQRQGPIDAEALRNAVKEYVKARGPAPIRPIPSNVRIGHPPPNLLFEHAPGHALTLRKLSGRPAVLVFWRGTSEASIEALRDLQARGGSDGPAPVVLAINDGDPPDVAAKLAAEHGISAPLVTDRTRAISQAYGIRIWPTIIDVDALGAVRRIRYGYSTATRGVEQHV